MKRIAVKALIFSLPLLSAGNALAAGKIYATTQTSACADKVNVFGLKPDVYLQGAGLANGAYYVKVTEPGGGTVLGQSIGTTLNVTGGAFAQCYRVVDLVVEVPGGAPGFATTPNPAPQYRVTISTDSTFPSNNSESDIFKVLEESDPPLATLRVNKFYDANVDGINNDAQPIAGWQIRIQDGIDIVRYTPVVNTLDPDTYTVTESMPNESNWIRTTANNPVIVTLAEGDDTTIEFGNVCTGAGGGKSHGFWGNTNGKNTINDLGSAASEMALLSGYNLRNANGSEFNPGAYDQFKTWNGSASAINMAYMLSVQMSANVLAIEAGFVNPGQLVYAPGLLAYTVSGLSATGFITVANLIAAADTELGLHGSTFAGSPDRAYQEALKNVLDKLANNMGFVQATPCPFTFPL
jgi:hypothetical protein